MVNCYIVSVFRAIDEYGSIANEIQGAMVVAPETNKAYKVDLATLEKLIMQGAVRNLVIDNNSGDVVPLTLHNSFYDFPVAFIKTVNGKSSLEVYGPNLLTIITNDSEGTILCYDAKGKGRKLVMATYLNAKPSFTNALLITNKRFGIDKTGYTLFGNFKVNKLNSVARKQLTIEYSQLGQEFCNSLNPSPYIYS